MLGDDETTVGDLKSAIQAFAEARDWMQFHDPKNLVMAMASEIGELSDHFRWLRSGESAELLKDPLKTGAWTEARGASNWTKVLSK